MPVREGLSVTHEWKWLISSSNLLAPKTLNIIRNYEVQFEMIKMVNIGDYEVREGLYYHKEHFWVSIEGGLAKFGPTDYGQKALKEIVFVELPSVGDRVIQ
ncbi:MAG: hypothetical protein V1850_05845, partial [Candidatus Bathyarchaeota archaeon]